MPRAAVADHRDDAPVGETQRRPRVAAVGRVRVELVGGRTEPLGVRVRVVGDLAAGQQQRPGLQQVAARRGRELVPALDPRPAALNVQAGADGVPRGVERHVLARDAVGAHLTERDPVRSREEPAD